MAIRKTVESFKTVEDKEIPLHAPAQQTEVSKPSEKRIAMAPLKLAEVPGENGANSTDKASCTPSISTVTDGEAG